MAKKNTSTLTTSLHGAGQSAEPVKELSPLERAIHEAEAKFATAQAEFKSASAQLNYLLKFREKQNDIDFLRQEYLNRILSGGVTPEATTASEGKPARAAKLTGKAREQAQANLFEVYKQNKGFLKRAEVMDKYNSTYKPPITKGHYQDLTRQLWNEDKIKHNAKEKSLSAYGYNKG